MKQTHWNQKEKPLLPEVFFQFLLLTKLNIMSVDTGEKMFTGLLFIIAEQGMKDRLGAERQ